MSKAVPKTQDTYLHDMLEAARLIHSYMADVTFDEFWHSSEKRDAVALRISVLGKSAHRIDKATEAALPAIPFKSIRGMRNRVAHDCGAVDFKIVWAVTQAEIRPLITALETYFKARSVTKPGNLDKFVLCLIGHFAGKNLEKERFRTTWSPAHQSVP